ncbi:MAG TPA: hypothetical protein VL651_06310 [Bacteroidia bacterium]|jgi:hypothetical protein|nr:hypothetical protein [Bacteroidia bacterium]
MKSIRLGIFLFFAQLISITISAQSGEPMRPGVAITMAEYLDSASGKPEPKGKLNINVVFPDTSRQLTFGKNGGWPFFQNELLDSIRFSCSTPGYHVTSWKIKKVEWGDIEDANGNKTGEKWWTISVKIYIAKD